MLKTNEKVYVKSLANFILAGYFILRAISVCACGQMNSLEAIPHTYENKYQSQLISLYFASYSWKLKPGFSLKRENPETSLAASRLFFSSVWKKKKTYTFTETLLLLQQKFGVLIASMHFSPLLYKYLGKILFNDLHMYPLLIWTPHLKE